MPYRRRYSSRRRRPRRNYSRGSSGTSALTIASRALAVAYGLKRLLNVERKYKDKTFNGSVANTGLVHSLSHTSQGDDDTDRQGRSVKSVSILIRGTVTVNASANGSFVRLILFLDKQNSGSTAAVTDLLESADHLSPLNKDFGKRFRVIWSRNFNVNTDSRENGMFKIYRKVSSHVEFNGTTATDGTGINSGGLFFLMISSEATNTPTVDYSSRFTFLDN